MRKFVYTVLVFSLMLFALSACQPGEAAPTEAPAQEVQPTEAPTAAPTEVPTEVPPTEAPPTEVPPTEMPAPTEDPGPPPLAPEPQDFTFTAADGQELPGRYYPAAVNPAPVVVLMHWAGGDQNDWVEIAYWLQNRGLGGQSEVSAPWLDPSWFPPMPESASFAVFTFSFRGCDGGCSDFDTAGFLLDAQAAMQTAAGLEGVDPLRVLSAGASIGADGAPDGCLYLNESSPACQGAFSFSPGSYLTLPYADVINGLEGMEPPVPVHCLYASGDTTSAQTCQSAGGEHYLTHEWSGDMHGMRLIQPGLEPNALELFVEFVLAELE